MLALCERNKIEIVEISNHHEGGQMLEGLGKSGLFTKIQGRIVSFIGIVILDIMIPGMGRMNPRMMKKLQKQIEKATEEIDATKVIIENTGKKH